MLLTKCDFEQWDNKTRRLLIVGLTRARVHPECVMSERAGEVLARVFSLLCGWTTDHPSSSPGEPLGLDDLNDQDKP